VPADDAESLIAEARRHQAALLEHREKAKEHQDARNRLLHQAWATKRWSYTTLAEAVGMERGAVIWILRQPAP
jgi:hypothetical protein